MMSGFGGSIEQLKSSIGVLLTSLGQLLADYLTPIIAKIQELINKFNGLDDSTKQTIIKIAMIAAFVNLWKNNEEFRNKITAIQTVITTVWNAIVGFITPILEGIKSFFEIIWNAVSTAVSTAINTIHNVITTVWDAVYGFISGILNSIWSVISSV